MEKKEEKKKVYDFTKVMMEVKFDEFEETNISRSVGNAIHQNTGDIGIDDIAREIYRNGKVELTEEQAKMLARILEVGETTLLIATKKAAIELLTKNE